MKKIVKLLCAVLLVCAGLHSSAQDKGSWFQDNDCSAAIIHDAKVHGYVGLRRLIDWNFIEPSKGIYTGLATLKADAKQCADSGLYFFAQVQTGQNSPLSWMTSVDHIATYVTDDDNFPGPYPNYYDAKYKTAVQKLYDTTCGALATLDAGTKAKFKGLFFGIGSTGDFGPHKGKPIGSSYGITDDATWQAQAFTWYDQMNAAKAKCSFVNLGFNPQNNGENIAYLRARYPGCWLKHGDPTHQVPNDGEGIWDYYPDNDYFAETQGAMIVAGAYAKKNAWAMVTMACAKKQTQIDFTGGWNTNVNDTSISNWFTLHVYDRVNYKRGYCKFADLVSIDSTLRFTTTAYGELIPAVNMTAYNRRISAINSSTVDELYKKQQRMDAVQKFVNVTRVNNLYAGVTGASHSTTAMQLNDYVYSATDNYSVNVRQIAINGTSIGAWRMGDAGSKYGRFLRGFKLTDGAPKEMYFDINDSLGGYGNKMQITVVYLDSGTGSFSINCFRCGKKAVMNVTKTNSGLFKTAVVTVSNFKFGNRLTNGCDYTIKWTGGDNTFFDYTDVVNVLKP